MHIHITVKIALDISTELYDVQQLVDSYKKQTQKEFSRVLGNVYDASENIKYSGSLVFENDATIGMTIDVPTVKESADDLVPVGT